MAKTEAKPKSLADALESDEPVFVNNQVTVVSVFNEARQRVDVHPLHMMARHDDGNYYVVGEHYRQFSRGPGSQLTFLDPDNVAKPVADKLAGMVNKDMERLRAGREMGDPNANRRPGAGRDPVRPPPTPPQPPRDLNQIAPGVQSVSATTRLGAVVPTEGVVLDVPTKEAMAERFRDVPRAEATDLASYILHRRVDHKNAKLPPHLAHYKQVADEIADEIDPDEGPDDDPENANNTLPESQRGSMPQSAHEASVARATVGTAPSKPAGGRPHAVRGGRGGRGSGGGTGSGNK